MAEQSLVYESFGKGKPALWAHGQRHSTDEDWTSCYERLRADVLSKLVKKVVVYTAGGSLLSNQRAAFVALTQLNDVKVSIVIENSGQFIDPAGCTVGVRNWSGRLSQRAYAPGDLRVALDDLSATDSEELVSRLRTHRQEHGIEDAA